MLNYIVRRSLYGVLILIGVNLATFFLFFTVNTPDDMARLNIGGKRVTPELIARWKEERGYDKPLYFNDAKQGSEKLTETIFWERSVSLFSFRFGRADGESAGDIGSEVARRMWVSLHSPPNTGVHERRPRLRDARDSQELPAQQLVRPWRHVALLDEVAIVVHTATLFR